MKEEFNIIELKRLFVEELLAKEEPTYLIYRNCFYNYSTH